MNQLEIQYIAAAKAIMRMPEISPRGMRCKEILNYMFVIEDCSSIIYLDGVKTNIDYALEELRWYYSGTNRLDFSPQISKIWSKYSDDGITVNSAYGYRIFNGQWQWIIDELKHDRYSRRAVININNADDKKINMNLLPTKDFPCTISMQFFIRDEMLHMTVYMRSQDLYFGLRNDIFRFKDMHHRLSKEIGVLPGIYTHFCGSLHIYEKDYEKFKKLIGDGETK